MIVTLRRDSDGFEYAECTGSDVDAWHRRYLAALLYAELFPHRRAHLVVSLGDAVHELHARVRARSRTRAPA